MNKILIIALILGGFACTQTPSYKVNIKLKNAEGQAYLNQKIKGGWAKVDSALLVNGGCQFKGTVKYPEVYFLSVGENKERLPFFVENSEIQISGVVDSLTSAIVTGSVVQNEYCNIQNKIDQLDKQGMELYNQSKEAGKLGDNNKSDSLMVLSDAIFNSIDELQKDYIKANPQSYVSPFLLSRVYYEMEADVLDNYLSVLDPRLDSVSIVISLKKRVAKLQEVAIGQVAPDFNLNDVNGNPVKLSDIYQKNEYTLIDFWASWCGPCRRENPNVVDVFNKYNAKGFGVLGVSLDSDKAKWEKAIADDKLTWTHVSDLKGWKNEAAALYSINSIPSNLLVDKTGKIIGRNLREAKLREAIAELLK